MLMVSAGEAERRVDEHRAFVDAAAAAGVRHLVYISFYGASAEATFTLARDHHVTEQHIEQSGMAWTFLRDNLYADFFPMMAGDDGVIRGPAGDGRVAAVAQDDVASAVTAVLLASVAHEGRTYSLTGPEALTLTEAAATMSRVLGRHYAFVDETVEEAYASRAVYGAPGLAARRLGEHLHRDRLRRAGRRHAGRGAAHRPPAEVARGPAGFARLKPPPARHDSRVGR